MKPWVRALTVGLLTLAALGASGCTAWSFLTDVKDKGGMVNPNWQDSTLYQMLEGNWQSADGRWGLTITRETVHNIRMVLSLDGEAAVECSLSYLYSDPAETQLSPEESQLTDSGGNPLGEIKAFYHEGGEGSGTLHLTLGLEDGAEEAITLVKP